MARRPAAPPLAIWLNGRHVGRLRKATSGAIDFTYDADWLNWESALAVSLSMPLREERYVGAPVSHVFDNLLPDNDKIRALVAAKVGAHDTDAYTLLAALGRDCVGALQFLPEGADPGPVGAINGQPVSDADIADILNNLASAPLGLEPEDDFRISIAGAQEKTAFLRHEGQWLRPTGTTPTTHIFKPQIGQLPNGIDLSNSVENEFFCLDVLRRYGLPTAGAEMARFGERPVLIIERFDRLLTRDGRLLRLPQEDMCQALTVPWTLKYERDGGPGVVSILGLLRDGDGGRKDQETFLTANVLFWLLGATDGHAKNFSIFLYPQSGYRLTPLYDVLSAQPSLDAHQIRQGQMKLAMALGDRRHYRINDIAPRHVVQSALRAGLTEVSTRETLARVHEQTPAALDAALNGLTADFPLEMAEAIVNGAHRRLGLIARYLDVA